MAILHCVRHGCDYGVRRHLRALSIPGAALLALFTVACWAEQNPNPPDPLLRDSLGLSETDRVHRVRLGTRGTTEVVEPSLVELDVGSYLEFVTRDGRVRTVEFVVESLSESRADFLQATGQESSPPLVELDSRFIVSFQEAPPGRYPFVVSGNAEPVSGVVVVSPGHLE